MRTHCPDCGAKGEREGHQTCRYPGLRPAVQRRTDRAFEIVIRDMNKLRAFADRLEREQRARLAREHPMLMETAKDDQYRVAVHAGPKYTRVDFNGSGKYMIVNATGEIFGIKSYGVIHRRHAYGTLDGIDAWDWAGYTAVKRSAKGA